MLTMIELIIGFEFLIINVAPFWMLIVLTLTSAISKVTFQSEIYTSESEVGTTKDELVEKEEGRLIRI